MCMIASLMEQRKQKKAADKARRQAKAAPGTATAAAPAARHVAQAQAAAEAQTVDTGYTSDMSAAQRLHGVGSTYLASRQMKSSLGD